MSKQRFLEYPRPFESLSFESFLADEGQLDAMEMLRQKPSQKQLQAHKKMTESPSQTRNGISKRFLKELTNERNYIAATYFKKPSSHDLDAGAYDDIVTKSRNYFEKFYVMSKIIENNRKKYHTNGTVPRFMWTCPDGRVYEELCWRFEIIMSGYMYAACLFNQAMVMQDTIKAHNAMMTAYTVLRHVCLEQVLDWSTRHEHLLPFESTEQGITVAISIIKICMQRDVIISACYTSLSETNSVDAPGIETFISSTIPTGIPYDVSSELIDQSTSVRSSISAWMFHECRELQSILNARKRDGSAVYFSDWTDNILELYKLEALAFVLYFSADASVTGITIPKRTFLFTYATKAIDDALHIMRIKHKTYDMSTVHPKSISELLKYMHSVLISKGKQSKRVENTTISDSDTELSNKTSVWSLLPDNPIHFYRNVRIENGGMDKFRPNESVVQTVKKYMSIQSDK